METYLFTTQGFNKETITNINKHFVIYVDYDGNLFKTKISWANQPSITFMTFS